MEGASSQGAVKKVVVRFQPVSSAPILKQSSFRAPAAWTFRDLLVSLRKQLRLQSSASLVRGDDLMRGPPARQ
jgi:hypothetical protein